MQPRGRGGERDPAEDGRAAQPRELADSRGPRWRTRSRALGVEQGDRVGTFAWNNQRHFELYMAIPCTGAVLHTLNVRLFSEQLVYIINHAEDRVIFLDDVARAADGRTRARARVRGALRRDRRRRGRPACPAPCATRSCWREAGPEPFEYPELDERQAAALCYTSGTTGNPKGVLYSHRSISMHSTATLMRDGTGPGARRPGAGGGADVPRQRLGPALRGRARGLGPDPPGPLPRRRIAGRADQLRSARP